MRERLLFNSLCMFISHLLDLRIRTYKPTNLPTYLQSLHAINKYIYTLRKKNFFPFSISFDENIFFFFIFTKIKGKFYQKYIQKKKNTTKHERSRSFFIFSSSFINNIFFHLPFSHARLLDYFFFTHPLTRYAHFFCEQRRKKRQMSISGFTFGARMGALLISEFAHYKCVRCAHPPPFFIQFLFSKVLTVNLCLLELAQFFFAKKERIYFSATLTN